MTKRDAGKSAKDVKVPEAAQKAESTLATVVAKTSSTDLVGPDKTLPKDAETPASPKTVEEQVRLRYLSVLYTHKAHEKDAEICTAWSKRLKLAQIVTSAITAGGSIVVIIGDSYLAKVVTTTISLLAAIVSAISRGMDLDRRAQEHRWAADGMWELRQAYESFLVDLHEKSISRDEACVKRDELFAKEAAINKKAPRTSPKAYAMAGEALKHREEYTSSDAEIDMHLPPSLRKDNRK